MDVIPSENIFWKEVCTLAMLRAPDMYKLLGLSGSTSEISFSYENSDMDSNEAKTVVKTITVKSVDPEENRPEFVYSNKVNNLVSSFDHLYKPNYWYEYDNENKIVIVNYEVCHEIEDYGIEAFANDVFEFIDNNEVEKLVVDLRCNLGGNSSVFDAFRNKIARHKKFNKQGKLFVLVGNVTFSSGVGTAAMMKRLTNATIIGEPTGGKPNNFGNVIDFSLPNSGLELMCSTRYFEFYPNYDHDSLYPDVTIKRTLDDFIEGNDPVYNYVVENGSTK